MALSSSEQPLSSSQIEDLRLAAYKLLGAGRRSFQAEMALKYCEGSARLAETVYRRLHCLCCFKQGQQE